MADILEKLLRERAEREEGQAILKLRDAYNKGREPREASRKDIAASSKVREGSLKEEIGLYKSYIAEIHKNRQNRALPREESRYSLTSPDSHQVIHKVLDVAFDSLGHVLIACDDGLARVMKFGREIISTSHIAPVLACDLWNTGACNCSTSFLTACSSKSSIRVHAHIKTDLSGDEKELYKLHAHFTVGAEETRALVFLSPTMVGCGSSDGKLRVFETSGEGTRVFISIGDDSESRGTLSPIVSLTSSSGAHHQQVVAVRPPQGKSVSTITSEPLRKLAPMDPMVE